MSYGFLGFKEVLDKAKTTAMPKYLPIFNSVYLKAFKINSLNY